MPEWNVEVRRVVAQRQIVYAVEADTPEEAKRLAVVHALEFGSQDFWADVEVVEAVNAPYIAPWPEDPL